MPAPTILSTDPITPLESIFNSIGVNGLNQDITARAFKEYKVADFTALAALSTAPLSEGDEADNAVADVRMRWNGATWVQITPAIFLSATARDTEYAKASGVYLVQGTQVRRTDMGWTEQYFAAYNASTNPTGAAVAGWYPVTGLLPYVAARNLVNTGLAASAYLLVSAAWGSMSDLYGFTYSAGAFTCTVAGWYDIKAHLQVPIASSPLAIQVTLNSTTVSTATSVVSNYSSNWVSGDTQVDASGSVKLAIGDIVRVYVFTSVATTPANATSIRLDVNYRTPNRI